jgi:hypothetical protein
VSVPAAVAEVGDLIFANNQEERVASIRTYAPGGAPYYVPIHNGSIVRVVTTTSGVRRYLGHPVGDSYRGMEIIDEHPNGVVFVPDVACAVRDGVIP